MAAALFIDLFDTLVLIDEVKFHEGRAAMARLAGVSDLAFMDAWRPTSHAAQTGELPTTLARCLRTLELLGQIADPGKAKALARLDVDTLFAASRLYPGAGEFLTAAHARFPGRLALVSNAAANAAELTAHLGLDSHFDQMIFSFAVGALKPDPAIYQAAIQAVHAGAKESWFIGDGAGGELEGARAVGLRPLCIDHPLKFNLLRGDPVVDPAIPVVRNFTEALARIGSGVSWEK